MAKEVATDWKVFYGKKNATNANVSSWLGTRTWREVDFVANEAVGWAFGILALAVIFVLLPIRSCLQRCVADDAIAEDKVTYAERVHFFQSDYDVSNPLTAKAGKLRMLQLQIDSTDDPEAKKALEEQKASVSNMSAVQQMQSYVVQNHARAAAYTAAFNPVQAAVQMQHNNAVARANFAHQHAIMNQQRQMAMMQRQMQFAMNPMGMQRIGGFAQSSSTTTTSTTSSSVGMMRPPAPPIGMAHQAVAPVPQPMMPMQPPAPMPMAAPMPAPMAAVHQQTMMVNPHAAMHQQAMANQAAQM